MATFVEKHSGKPNGVDTPVQMDQPLTPDKPADAGERTLTLTPEMWDIVEWEFKNGKVDKKKHDTVLDALFHQLKHAKSELKRIRKVTDTNEYRRDLEKFTEEWDKYLDADPGFLEKNPKQKERYDKEKKALKLRKAALES
jgi:hypothetical protein